MKDRYLHRGRRVDSGEWVYGTLAIKGTAMFIIGEIQDYSDEYIYPEFWWKVIPETVGQCAGLKDKNGKLIFEGDILSFTVFDYNDYDTQYTGVVVWHGSRYTIWNNPDSEYYGSDGGFDLDWVIGQDCEIEVEEERPWGRKNRNQLKQEV